jgi:hypothetical protein
MKKVVRGNTFCGNPISEYGQKYHRVDYATLAKAFDAVLCNEIMNVSPENWFLWSGSDYDKENDRYIEIYQYYIISSSGAELLQFWTDEIVYYNEELDMYVWGVTHWGTAWDYVLTDIKIETPMSVKELNKTQFWRLKRYYYKNVLLPPNAGVTAEELDNVDDYVTDEEIVKYYDGVKFYGSDFVDGGMWYE